ncbi:MAG: flavodoxin domain-containing protein, partial [Methanomassiliicoccales archaeon]
MGENMLKTLVIYESKYGSTQEVAGWLSLLLGPARLVGLHDLPADYQANDFIIIGFPIYAEQIPYNIQQFIIANQEWLQSKPVALFCTCMHLGNGQRLLDDLKELYLPAATTKALSGKLDFDRLSSKDQELLVHFRQQTGNRIKSYNHLNPA